MQRLPDNIFKKAILFVLLLFLLAPLVQFQLSFITHIKPLNGSFITEKDTSFNWKAWFEGSYQQQKENYVKENFGFHNSYVRLHNQLDYSLFDKANAAYVAVGKNNYLYETGYIDAYYGKDFIGQQEVNNYLLKLKQVQDTLQKKNKLLLVVFAPGKASYYPEYIPDAYRANNPGISNYTAFTSAAQKLSLNHIDFNKYFISRKDKSPYPLYPQYGIHWSDYGALLAYDSMTKYIASGLHTSLPKIRLVSEKVTDTLQNTDDDLIRGMNLMCSPKTFKMAYPQYEIIEDTSRRKKPKLLVVADSFWWYIFSTGYPSRMFRDHEFWYYNKEINTADMPSALPMEQADYASRLTDADAIVLLYTESTLNKFGNGFVDVCYNTFCAPDIELFYGKSFKKNSAELLAAKNSFAERVRVIENTIRADNNWMHNMSEKAAKWNISLDSAIKKDAIWLTEDEFKKEYEKKK